MKKPWTIGFILVLVGAFAVMWLAGRGSSSLPAGGQTAEFNITASDHVKGDTESPSVTIVKWSDFQCPACASYYPVLQAIVEEFPDDVRVVYRHFPLIQIHAQAEPSARASEAAALQGKFWEMHNALFENQSEWASTRDISAFDKYAQEIGLDMEKYRADLESDAVRNRVSSNLDEAIGLGLNSTPSLFVNGKRIVNPNSYDAFRQIVEAEIAALETAQ